VTVAAIPRHRLRQRYRLQRKATKDSEISLPRA